ncbi:hypothetical protein M9H77_25698 [Catharanthus roseus]|uniref:Uncharacterized protein n=1 Tax=Catharanthus roseus TaxID=4058 RepID=A0ACC0A7N5_CATRO|nr:hypothetical protein M9H77_25698 [Catharanthus roseus]
MYAQKIYNVFAKIKKNSMQGQNTIEEVLCLSAQRGYTIFYRNAEDSNVLSDIVVAHPISIAMIRTWLYVLIMDITYNMPLLEAVGMTPTGYSCRKNNSRNKWKRIGFTKKTIHKPSINLTLTAPTRKQRKVFTALLSFCLDFKWKLWLEFYARMFLS